MVLTFLSRSVKILNQFRRKYKQRLFIKKTIEWSLHLYPDRQKVFKKKVPLCGIDVGQSRTSGREIAPRDNGLRVISDGLAEGAPGRSRRTHVT